MYSDKIDKICRVCRYAAAVKGSRTHMECKRRGGYTPIDGSCGDFSYDIFKKTTRRRKAFSTYSAEDFKI